MIPSIKMYTLSSLFSLTFLFNFVELCTSPLGAQSECISVNDCEPFRKALQTQDRVLYRDFMKASLCGFDGKIPTVCCGPLPILDSVSKKDSYLSPKRLCGVDSLNSLRILGGADAAMKEHPWMALLGYIGKLNTNKNNTLTFQCGGALINRRYVLTAAHCVTGDILQIYGPPTIIRLGEYDLRTEIDCMEGNCAYPVQDIPVLSAYPHEEYLDNKENRHNDIAIVRMAKRVEVNDYVRTICVTRSKLPLSPATSVVVVGWGATLEGSKSNIKQKITLPIFDKAKCVERFSKHRGVILTDEQICAGGEFRQDTCRGDSGGPLMLRRGDGAWEAVGIVSFGMGCGLDGVPAVYTAVGSYLGWIRNILKTTNV